MSTEFRIEIRRSAQHTVLETAGELDVASAGELLTQGRAVAAEDADGAVVVDMREVTFMDSTGLRALLSTQEACREQGRGFSVITGARQVQRLMAITRTMERLNVRDDVESLGG